jgi:hypothetical protein
MITRDDSSTSSIIIDFNKTRSYYYLTDMKSSLDRYQESEQVELILTELNQRNSSAEKLPLLRKPFRFNPSFKTVKFT